MLDVERGGDRRGEHHRRDREQARAGEERRAEQPGQGGEAEDEADQDAGAQLPREVRRV